MPKSFSIDLNGYTLYRTMGNNVTPLKTRVDRADVIGVLNNLGYDNITECSSMRGRFGVIPSLEDTLAGWTVGIPTTATVKVKSIGHKSHQLMITFTF